jgi:transposase
MLLWALAGCKPKPGQEGTDNNDDAWGGHLRNASDEIISPASQARILINEILARQGLANLELDPRGLIYAEAPSRGRKKEPPNKKRLLIEDAYRRRWPEAYGPIVSNIDQLPAWVGGEMSWRRGQAYAQHLRDRVLAAVDGGIGVDRAAALFRVHVSWIYRALARRRQTGESTARPQINHVPPKLLAHYAAIRAKLTAQPHLTLAELRAWLRNQHQVSISQRGIWKTLRQLGLTRKEDPACDGT